MNDSFRKSCTVQLPSDLDTEISVNVPVSGSGVHLGYVYMIQAILHTTDGDQIEKDIIAKGMNGCTTKPLYIVFLSSYVH